MKDAIFLQLRQENGSLFGFERCFGCFFFVPCWEKQVPGSESADRSQTGSKGRRGDFEGGAVINSDGLAPDPPGDRPIGGVRAI